MTAVLLLWALAQVPETSAPPLAPAPEGEAVAPVAEQPERVFPQLTPVPAEEEAPPSPAKRMAATLGMGAAAMAVGAGVAALVLFIGASSCGGGFCGLGYLAPALGAFVLSQALFTPFGAWLGHRMTGATAHYGWALLGGLVSSSAGAAIFGGAAAAGVGGVPLTILGALSVLIALAGPLVGLELSYRSKLAPDVALGPTRGGAFARFSWAF